jgi:hypothetical protein
MTGSIRKVTFLALCGLLSASAVMAGVPSATFSSVGTFIRLGGRNNANVVEPASNKVINVRDAGNTVVQNSTVEIRFGVCTSTGEFRICDTQPHPGVGVSCVDKAVIAVTDASGNATFRVVGNAVNPGGGSGGVPAAGLGDTPCAEVRADGQLLGSLRVKAYDQNGSGGVNPVDLSLFLNDSFNSASCGPYPRAACAAYRSRSDYNDTGSINPVDLSLFLSVSFATQSNNSCAPAAAVCAP